MAKDAPDWLTWLPAEFRVAAKKIQPKDGYWLVKDDKGEIRALGPNGFAAEYQPK